MGLAKNDGSGMDSTNGKKPEPKKGLGKLSLGKLKGSLMNLAIKPKKGGSEDGGDRSNSHRLPTVDEKNNEARPREGPGYNSKYQKR
jgi:hypothetical protein